MLNQSRFWCFLTLLASKTKLVLAFGSVQLVHTSIWKTKSDIKKLTYVM